MKILHVLDHSLPLHSGYTFRSEAILREQQRRGWQPLMLTTPKQGPQDELVQDIDGLRFYRTPSNGREGLLDQMRLTRNRLLSLCQTLMPDLIHAHSPVLNALPALAVRRKLGIPVVYEMRASWEDAAVDHGTTVEGSLRYRASRLAETFALLQADQVTTICEGLKQDILMRGVRAGKVTVIPNAVDTTAFRFDPQPDLQRSQELGLQGCTVLGFLGSFYHYEGLHLLIEALGRLKPTHPDLRLLLVGGGFQEEALKHQAQALGVGESVVFTGRVPHAEVEKLYALTHLLVYPRLPVRLTELVTPLKPLEAMAQGRLVLASDVGGHRELIRDGQTGALFRAGDVDSLCQGIQRMLASREIWPKIREQGRRFVESERTWMLSVARYQKVYEAALAKRTRRGA